MNKKLMSAVLAGAMTLAMAVPAFANDEQQLILSGSVTNNTSAYLLSIPSGKTDLNLKDTANVQTIGDLKVTRTADDKTASLPFNTDKKVTVTVKSDNSGKLVSTTEGVTDSIAYTLGIGDKSVTDWTTNPTQDFSASNIDSETAVALTATVTGDATKVENGTYQDTLTFSAGLVDIVTFSFFSPSSPEYCTVDKGTTWAQWASANPTFWGCTVSVAEDGYVSFVEPGGGRMYVMDRNASGAKQKGTDLIEAHSYTIGG